MTAASPILPRGLLAHAGALLDGAIRECAAHGRPDLADRLTAARAALDTAGPQVVVLGDFKQGKSTLVNTLIGADVCPIDDTRATAVPTYVRYAAQRSAAVRAGDGAAPGEPLAEADVPAAVLEDGAAGGRPAVELAVPAELLAGGLTLVDMPGAGGLGSASGAAGLAALAGADAGLFVSSAEEELTAAERDYLGRARRLCDTVHCVLTKADFYPGWRAVRDADAAVLATLDVRLLVACAPLRVGARATGDAGLEEESGYPALVEALDIVVDRHAARLAATVADQVTWAYDQLIAQLRVGGAEAVARAAALAAGEAPWRRLLDTAVPALTAELAADLDTRLALLLAAAEEAAAAGDPADSWAQLRSWLYGRTGYALTEHKVLRRERFAAVAGQVAAAFDTQARAIVENLTGSLSGSGAGRGDPDLVPRTLAGIRLGPVDVGITLVMGSRTARDEKDRELRQRRHQAAEAVRRYYYEVGVAMGTDSAQAVDRFAARLRAYHDGLAAELGRTVSHRTGGGVDDLRRLADLRRNASAAG